MNTTHVIVFPVADPEALRLYTNESLFNVLSDPSAFPWRDRPTLGEREDCCGKAKRWFWDGGLEFTIAGVTFVRRSVR